MCFKRIINLKLDRSCKCRKQVGGYCRNFWRTLFKNRLDQLWVDGKKEVGGKRHDKDKFYLKCSVIGEQLGERKKMT